MLSAQSKLELIWVDEILRLATAKLDERPATAIRGRHPQIYAGEYHRRAV